MGVVVSNLGSPDAPSEEAVRRYLAEFLWDPRVVQIPRPLWWLILHGIVLRTRPRKSAANYQKIWTPEGSPLTAISRQQVLRLRETLEREHGDRVIAALGMRYGHPSLPSALEELRRQGVGRLLLLPLYPQYSGATTASTLDAVTAAVNCWPARPELRVVEHYFDAPAYIEAVAESIRESRTVNGSGQMLIMSFHGMPERTRRAGDPYFDQCRATAAAIAARLGLRENQWTLTFQSRFGREQWLQPYTLETLRALPASGIREVDVVCPGFSADCLETLEEIALLNRDIFMAAGGIRYQYIPALNDRDAHIRLMADLVRQYAGDWLVAT
ncbi:MAG: ferrochelatase [Gammaproteobacteria bacterium]|nr:MAG: ferrochelatase [Gammaproteobacteria bacterium]TND07379.1 MAG: ferrochelatase [Gammaproteobacteria bacterium]